MVGEVLHGGGTVGGGGKPCGTTAGAWIGGGKPCGTTAGAWIGGCGGEVGEVLLGGGAAGGGGKPCCTTAGAWTSEAVGKVIGRVGSGGKVVGGG